LLFYREENRAFLMAAFDPEDVFDFSNPADVEEYEKLYPSVKRTQTKRPQPGRLGCGAPDRRQGT